MHDIWELLLTDPRRELQQDRYSLRAPVQVVLYSNKGKTSTLYKSLSMRFRGRAAFAEVRDTAKELTEAAGVVKFPTLPGHRRRRHAAAL